MPTIIINHTVKDYATWKTGFDADEERRTSMGATTLAVGQKAGAPGTVYAVLNATDMDAVGKGMADPNFQKLLEDMGVLTTDVSVLEN